MLIAFLLCKHMLPAYICSFHSKRNSSIILHRANGRKRKKSMRILIFGGTGFLGRHLVQAALERQHTVTLFNRGYTHPELFPHVEQLHGDRGGDLQALHGRTWDAVIDSNGQIPHQVRESASTLAE